MENRLDLLSDVLQIYNTILLENDAKNTDIMQALQEQNTKYFEEIINKLNQIREKQDDIIRHLQDVKMAQENISKHHT